MLTKLIGNSLKMRGLVILLFGLVVVLALFCLQNSRVDAIPDIGENQQIVFSEWNGRSPKDVEEQITYPLSVLLQGIPGVDRVRGASAFGFSVVTIIFKEDIDFYWSRSRILEKLSQANSILPKAVTPSLGPDATGLGQIFWYILENEPSNPNPLSLEELRSLQDFYLSYRLQSVDGVSEVASIGGFEKEYQIDVDPNKILAFDIHFPQILAAIKQSNSDVGAEVIEQGERELIIRGVGQFQKREDIEEVVVSLKGGTPIRVKDLATVKIGPAFRRGALDSGGIEAVGGIVTMRYGENPKRVINAIKERLVDIEKGLPKGVKVTPFYDRSQLIDNTMDTVKSALTQEILITALVVFLFLLNLRSSFLVALTLPLGVGISFIMMYLLDIESNIMSLSGLVIAIGTMVDMGIIMTENIYGHLQKERPQSLDERLKTIYEASVEVGPAILTAVLTTVITFIPVFALESAEGKLFLPLAWAKTLAMIGSVIVALFLIPVLSFFLLTKELPKIEENKMSLLIQKIYRPILVKVLNYRKQFLILPLVMILIGYVSFTRIGSEFMPSLNEGEILYMPVTTPDIGMTKARELLSYTDKVLESHPLVEKSIGKLGRAETSLDPAPIGMFETLIKLKPQSEWPLGVDIYDIMSELDELVQVPGLVNSWDFPIQTRVGMISTGIKTQVALKIFGDDLSVLQKLSTQAGTILEKVAGAYGVYAERIQGKPYVEIKIDRIAASRYGVNTGEINAIIQTAIGGMTIDEMIEGRERYKIRVRYMKDLRDDLTDLENILVPTRLGQHIPLREVAKIEITTGPAMIQSENGLLRTTVQLNVRDRDTVGFVKEAKETIERDLVLPQGYSVEWAGQFQNQQRANKRLLFLIPLSLVVNLLILYFSFRSLTLSSIVFTAVPVAASGGLLFLWLGGISSSVAVWVGFIALFGIAVDDGVILMTYLQKAVRDNPPHNLRELKTAILEAGGRRIRPLVMTTFTTVFALLPLLWSNGQGSEIMRPMAIPTLGGMDAQMISLFIVPVIFSFYYQRQFKLEN